MRNVSLIPSIQIRRPRTFILNPGLDVCQKDLRTVSGKPVRQPQHSQPNIRVPNFSKIFWYNRN